jgi:uncharacterized delta-60 repeat protein
MRVESQTVDSFNPNANNDVYALATQIDGKILAGGSFTTLGGQIRNHLGRLNPDGSLDLSFDPDANDDVRCIVVKKNGEIIVAGKFSNLARTARNYLGRLKSDGSMDPDFNPACNGPINSMVLQPDGKILIVGEFTVINGVSRAYIARLNGGGTLDETFDPQANNSINTIALQRDGKILLGGTFTTLAGETRNRIGRLNNDGSLDPGFATSANGPVMCMAMQPDGKILVGGSFTSVGGLSSLTGLARLDAFGVAESEFTPRATGGGASVYSIALQTDGMMLVGGNFTALNFFSRSGLGRVNASGGLDSNFNVSGGSGNTIYGISLQPDGKILLGGNFTTLGGQTRNRIARLNNGLAQQQLAFDGTNIVWSREGKGPEIQEAEFQYSSNGIDWQDLAAAEYTSNTWTLNGLNFPPQINIRARAAISGGYFNGSSGLLETIIGPPVVVAQPTSRTNNAATVATFSVLAGGTEPLFYQWQKGGVSLTNTGGISGVTNSTLTLNNVFGNVGGDYSVVVSNSYGSVTSVIAMLTVNDPRFSSQPASKSAAMGQSTSLTASAVGTGPIHYQWRNEGVELPGATNSFLTLTNLQLSQAGHYDILASNIFGVATSSVANLTINQATIDPFNPGTVNGEIYATATDPDGKTIVGGTFTSISGQSRNNIARLNTDGTLDPGFNPNIDRAVFSIALQKDGRILLAGWFTLVSGQPRTYIARLNADGSLDLTFNPIIDDGVTFPGVYSLATDNENYILIGGDFRTVQGQSRTNLARLNTDGALDATFKASADDIVYPLALQSDGKILVGGNFLGLNGEPCQHLGRLNSDGTLDTSFHSEVDNLPLCIAAQRDGKILIGGSFAKINGQVRTNLAQLNTDGSLDTNFALEANGVVRTSAIQSDDSLLIGGDFTIIGGASRKYIARFSRGALDTSFDPSANGAVYAVSLQPDGKVLAAGRFGTLLGETHSKIGRIDGAVPASEELRFDEAGITWLRGGSSPLIRQAGFDFSTNGTHWTFLGFGEQIMGGWQLAGVNLPTDVSVRARGIAVGGRYNGSSWFVETNIGPAVHEPVLIQSQPSSLTNNPKTLALFGVQTGGELPIIYQWFKDGMALTNGGNISGATTATLILNNVLGADRGEYSVVVQNFSGSVTSTPAVLTVPDPLITSQPVGRTNDAGNTVTFAVQATGTLPLSYQWYNGTTALVDDGNISESTTKTLRIVSPLGGDSGEYSVVVSNSAGVATSETAALVVVEPVVILQPIGKLVQEGQNVTMNVNAVGTALTYQWRKNQNDLPGASEASLTLTNVQASDFGNYDVIIHSTFGSVTSATALVSVNLATPEPLNAAANFAVYSIAPETDGKILVGGHFTTLAGQTRNRLGRLNSDGSLDTDFNPGASGLVACFAVQADGKILIGGDFTNVDSQTRNYLARLEPSGNLDYTFDPGANGSISAFLEQADGKILVGGSFTRLAGQSRLRLGRLNPDGSLDVSFNPGASSGVNGFLIQDDGQIVVGGNFATLGGEPRNAIGRLDTNGLPDATFNPGANGAVWCLAKQPDEKILVGGQFSVLGGKPRNRIARLNPDGTVDDSFNPGASDGGTADVTTIAVQADGQILVGGLFRTLAGEPRDRLGRLNSNGSLDWMINPAPNSFVNSLVLQTDGNILVGGDFTFIANRSSSRIERLSNSEPATAQVTFDGSRLFWLRSGASPEVWRTTFGVSTNGSDWSMLGSGSRTSNGWELDGLTLATNVTVRARGAIVGGRCNGSSWFVESIAQITKTPLRIRSEEGFESGSNQFGFAVSGTAQETIIVEGSSNLLNWIPIITNKLENGRYNFAEPALESRKFYRVRSE